jgi:hypothetical protein
MRAAPRTYPRSTRHADYFSTILLRFGAPSRIAGCASKGNAGPVNPCLRWTLGRFGYRFGPWTTKQGRGCAVNFRIILLAATTMLLGDVAMAQPAVTPATSTVTPVLSGTYIVRVTHVCQVLIDVTQTTPNPVAGVTVGNSGDANQNIGTIGTITFNHTTGKATMAADSIDGSPVLFSYNGAVPLGNVLTDTPPLPTRTRARRLRSLSRAAAV